jgi:hypothetical protein
MEQYFIQNLKAKIRINSIIKYLLEHGSVFRSKSENEENEESE